jgi:hypothetical protein
MEEELSKKNMSREDAEISNYSDQELQLPILDDKEFIGQENYHHRVLDDEQEEWSLGNAERSNLIVNYLPHEIDDTTLKVINMYQKNLDLGAFF